ncbi:TonB-dependent receptor domain-containing protein [Erythrobacter sp.]|jgi:outer membrane receptor protein involved in Fe transport|uniref:TonB-dependent receptor domain-containing protein n=1 Tax=Erythrobacter sp. TaxID=1042 RepID=UPI002EAF3821|nr:TonB-dependent receptor [Erythrobacter sp.]
MKTRLTSSIARSALCIALLSAPAAAFAQSEVTTAGSEPSARDNQIIVTGSLIRGTPEDAALPVDVFTAEDLRQQGVDSPLEFIKDLPSVGAVLGDTNQFSTAAQGFRGLGSINLRGLGATRTLTLLNGKRTINAPGEGFADTQLMPLFALERIEILKDGAGSTYGSDAIAGVANFITRSDFVGVELAGNYNFIPGSDGDFQVSALTGFEFGDANLVLGAGWQQRSELPTTERDFVNLPFEVNPSRFSALSTPGLFAVTYLDAATGDLDTQVRPDVGCEALGGFQDGALCRFSFVPFNNLIEDTDRFQVYGEFNVDLSDRARFHLDGLWARTELLSFNQSPAFPPTQGPRGSGFLNAFSTSPANPGLVPFLDQVGLPQSTPENPIVAVTNVLFRPFGYLGNPLNPDESRGASEGAAVNDGWRVSGGLEFDVGEALVLNVDGTFWEAKRFQTSQGIVGSRLQAALSGFGGPNCTGDVPGQNGCEFFNPFANAGPRNPAFELENPFFVVGNENSEELVNFIQIPNGIREDESQFIADIVLSGETGIELGGGPLAFAVGAQYRQNDFRQNPINEESDALRNPCFIEGDTSCVGTSTEGVGPFIFLGVFRPVAVEQSVYAVFAELAAPLTDRLEVSAAARFEDYGGTIGSTFNPKGSIRFEATDWVTLRGSIGTTFRGPLASNVADNSTTALQGFTAAGGNFKSLDIFGNPDDLGPETALTYNVGAIFSTGFGDLNVTFSADYWAILLEDQITTTPGEAIANLVGNGQTTGTQPVDCSSPLVNLVTFSGNQCIQGETTGIDISRVRTDFVNGPDVDIAGLDFALNVDLPVTNDVLLSFGGNAVYNLEYEFDDFELQGVIVQESYDAVGFGNYFRDPNTLPEWRANGFVNVNFEPVNIRYDVTHIDGVTDDRCIGVEVCFQTSQGPTDFGIESGSYTQHDIAVTIDLDIRGAEVQLQGAVENFTDEEPAEAQLPLGFNPFIGNAIGRNYRVSLRTRF